MQPVSITRKKKKLFLRRSDRKRMQFARPFTGLREHIFPIFSSRMGASYFLNPVSWLHHNTTKAPCQAVFSIFSFVSGQMGIFLQDSRMVSDMGNTIFCTGCVLSVARMAVSISSLPYST